MEQRPSPIIHPYLMLLFAPVLWASSNTVGKFSVGLLTPYQFTFYRWLVATLLLSLFFHRHIRRDFARLWARKWWLLFWGGSAFCVFNLLLYSAFQRGASVVNVGIIHALIPAMVIIGNALVFRERAHLLQWVGVALSLLGVFWLLSRGDPLSLFHWRPQPVDTLVLLTALIYTAYSLCLRQAPAVHWASLMWAMCVAAMCVALPFWGTEMARSGQWLQVASPDGGQWLRAILLVGYISLFVAILSKMFYMEGVLSIGASRAALVMNLLPLFNALFGLVLFADERAAFGSVHLIALMLVFTGISASEFGAQRKRRMLLGESR